MNLSRFNVQFLSRQLSVNIDFAILKFCYYNKSWHQNGKFASNTVECRISKQLQNMSENFVSVFSENRLMRIKSVEWKSFKWERGIKMWASGSLHAKEFKIKRAWKCYDMYAEAILFWFARLVIVCTLISEQKENFITCEKKLPQNK